MTRLILSILAASAGIFLAAQTAKAEASPVCLSSVDGGGIICNYQNFNQCQLSASGLGGTCIANPQGTAAYARLKDKLAVNGSFANTTRAEAVNEVHQAVEVNPHQP